MKWSGRSSAPATASTSAHLVALGVLIEALGAGPHVVPADGDEASVEVDVLPPQGDELSAPGAKDHRQPEIEAPLLVLLPCSLDKGSGLSSRRRLRVGSRLGPRIGHLGRVKRSSPIAPRHSTRR